MERVNSETSLHRFEMNSTDRPRCKAVGRMESKEKIVPRADDGHFLIEMAKYLPIDPLDFGTALVFHLATEAVAHGPFILNGGTVQYPFFRQQRFGADKHFGHSYAPRPEANHVPPSMIRMSASQFPWPILR